MNKILVFLKKWWIVLPILLVLTLIIGAVVKKRNYEKQILDLQNQLASTNKTIEDQKGLYAKLTIQTGDLKDLLNSKDAQIEELNNQVKQDKDQLVSVTTAVATWKKAYEGLANAHQTTEPPSATGLASRERVDFDKNFGYIEASGFTLTNPAEAYVKVQQNRPLRMTVALAQNKDKSWTTYATSSEDNVSVDIQVAGVNPLVLMPKWYEGIGFNAGLGAGDTGIVTALGATLKLGHFGVGPNVWLVSNGKLNPFYGVTFTWFPFER